MSFEKRFDKKFGKDYLIKSKPYDFIHRGVDGSYHIGDVMRFVAQEIEREREEIVDDWFSLAPKYRTRKKLLSMLKEKGKEV